MSMELAKKSRDLIAFITDIENSVECKCDIQNLVNDTLTRLTSDSEKIYTVAMISDDTQELTIYENDGWFPCISKLQSLSIGKALSQIKIMLEQDSENWSNVTVVVISDRNKFSGSDKKIFEDFTNSDCSTRCQLLTIYVGADDSTADTGSDVNTFTAVSLRIKAEDAGVDGTLAAAARSILGIGGLFAAVAGPIGAAVGGSIIGKILDADYSGCDGSSDSSKINSVKDVQFAVVVPKSFVKGNLSMVDILVYEKEFENVIEEVRGEYQTRTVKHTYSNKKIADETIVKVQLHSSSSQVKIDDSELVEKWDGKYLRFSFVVKVPEKFKDSQIAFMAKVFFNDVLATTLKFIADFRVSNDRRKISVTRNDISSAFISYASHDRDKVLRVLQGLRKGRPDLDVFFDVESLRSGEHWEARIAKEIEARDILYLCWSNSARLSKWVNYEWRYALQTKGLDGINPIPIEKCMPPAELSSLHFNENLLYYSSDA